MTCCQCDIALKNVILLSWKLNCALKFVVKSLQNKSGVFYSFLRGCILTWCQCDLLSVWHCFNNCGYNYLEAYVCTKIRYKVITKWIRCILELFWCVNMIGCQCDLLSVWHCFNKCSFNFLEALLCTKICYKVITKWIWCFL